MIMLKTFSQSTNNFQRTDKQCYNTANRTTIRNALQAECAREDMIFQTITIRFAVNFYFKMVV